MGHIFISFLYLNDCSQLVTKSCLIYLPISPSLLLPLWLRPLASHAWFITSLLNSSTFSTLDSILPFLHIIVCLVAQSYSTLWDPVDCSPPDSSVHWILLGKNTGVGCHFLLQGIFQTQGSNLCLLHCRRILYCLRHQGSWFFIFQRKCLMHIWFR